MKCCLCEKEIKPVRHWKNGYNAQPLGNGKCCSKCLIEKVIPERIKRDSGRVRNAKNSRR